MNNHSSPHPSSLTSAPLPSSNLPITRTPLLSSSGGPPTTTLRKKKKQPLFQTSAPIVRITADTTLLRPPKLTYGYCCLSGSHRDYAIGSQNIAMDRLMYIDNYTGNNEMVCFGGIEGIGFSGNRIAAWLANRIPDLISEVALTTAKSKKRQQQDEALALAEEKTNTGKNTYNNKPPTPAISIPSITYKEKLQKNAFDKVSVTAKQILQTIAKAHNLPNTESNNDTYHQGSQQDSSEPHRIPTKTTGTPTGNSTPSLSSSSSTPTPFTPYITSRPGTRIYYSTGPNTIHDTGVQKNGPEPLSKVQLRIGEILQDTLKFAQKELKEQNEQFLYENRSTHSSAPNPLDATASGASICLCVIKGRTLAIAHLGSVRAVLGRTLDVLSLQSTLGKVKHLAEENILAATVNSKSASATLGSSVISVPNHHTPVGGTYSNSGGNGNGSSSTIAPSTKYSRVSAAARMAKLTYDIGALNLTNPYGTTKPLVPVPSVGKDKLTIQPLNPLVTTSIPNFPDIPTVLENVLKHPESTYRKPSQILTQQRRDLVRSIQNSSGSSSNSGASIGGNTMTMVPYDRTDPNTDTNEALTIIDPYSVTDPKEKQRLFEQLEVRELTTKVKESVFDLRGRLVKKPTNRASAVSTHPPLSTESGTGTEGEEISSSSNSDNHSSLPTEDTDTEVKKHSTTAVVAYHSHTQSNHHDEEDNDSTVPVDFAAVPSEWTNSELGHAVQQKYPSSSASAGSSGVRGSLHRTTTTTASTSTTIPFSQQTLPIDTHPSSNDTLRTIPIDDTTAAALQEAKYYDDKGQPLGIPIAVPLTMDHRPDRPDERTRIYHHGGRVELGTFSDGSKGALPRIYGVNNDGPGLATSRTIGFFQGSSLGISHEPELTIRLLDPEDRFIIVASDGIWSVLSNDEAVRIVARCCESILYGGTGSRRTNHTQIVSNGTKKKRTEIRRSRNNNNNNNNNNDEEEENEEDEEKDNPPYYDDDVDGDNEDIYSNANNDDDNDPSVDTRITTSSSSDVHHGTILLSAMGNAKDTIYGNRHQFQASTKDTLSTGGIVLPPSSTQNILALTSGPSLSPAVANGTSTYIQTEYIPAALTTTAIPLHSHPASLAVAALPSLGSKPIQPLLHHPVPQIHIAPTPGTEMRLSICAGPAPVVGCGGDGVDVPTDLLESVLPMKERIARQNRLRRVAAACAEAVVSAAKKRWITYTGQKIMKKYQSQRMNGSNSSVTIPGGGVYDDLSCLVILLDHVKK